MVDWVAVQPFAMADKPEPKKSAAYGDNCHGKKNMTRSRLYSSSETLRTARKAD